MVKILRPVAILLLATSVTLHAQTQPERDGRDCGFKKLVNDALVNEAERDRFVVRRVEIAGSTYTRDREFRKRLNPAIKEGDGFSRVALDRGIHNLGKMKQIYPLTFEDVEIRLDRDSRDVDIVICVVQKPRLK